MFWGYIFKHNTVLRDRSHKNSDFEYDVCDHYHPYMSGIGWIITGDVAAWLVSAFPQNEALISSQSAASAATKASTAGKSSRRKEMFGFSFY
jgi:hypothetical protein